METFMMKIDDLKPADYNPRVDLQKGDDEYETLKSVITEFGFVQPIVFNKRTKTIVGGHQRWKVAKDLGYTEVPTVIVDLEESDEKVLNLALNKVGGSFDERKLGELLAELQDSDVQLELTGFDGVEIAELTLAFGDSDLPFSDFDDSEQGYEFGDDGEEESEGSNDNEKGYIIQYNIIFDDELQQEVWHSFLAKLKNEYDNETFPTQASRIHAFLKREVFK